MSVAGTFNNWTPEAMQKNDDGTFELTLEVPVGEIEFKFVVDGEWKESSDYDTKLSSMNSLNNVQLVEMLDKEQLENKTNEAGSNKVESFPAPSNVELSTNDEHGGQESRTPKNIEKKEEETLQDKAKEERTTNIKQNSTEKAVESGRGWKQRCCVS